MSVVEASYARLVDYDADSDEESAGCSASENEAMGKGEYCHSSSGLLKRRVDVVGKPQVQADSSDSTHGANRDEVDSESRPPGCVDEGAACGSSATQVCILNCTSDPRMRIFTAFTMFILSILSCTYLLPPRSRHLHFPGRWAWQRRLFVVPVPPRFLPAFLPRDSVAEDV